MKHESTNLFSTLLVFIHLLIKKLVFYPLNYANKRLFRKIQTKQEFQLKNRIESSTKKTIPITEINSKRLNRLVHPVTNIKE